MPSRRAVLTAVAASTTALAGCSGLYGSASSDDGGARSCETSAERRDDSSDLIQQADVSPHETVVFRVVLNRDAPEFEAFDEIRLVSPTGESYLLPREDGTNPEASDRRIYTQALGEFPQNGRMDVLARDGDGEQLDALTVEFTCHRTTPARDG